MKLLISVLSMLALAGCATVPMPTQAELQNANYGPPPQDYQATIKNYMANVLRDPESARYKFGRAPVKGWAKMAAREYGYVVCALINSKNGFGGYTGDQQSFFFLKNDEVWIAEHSDGKGGVADYIVAQKCSTI